EANGRERDDAGCRQLDAEAIERRQRLTAHELPAELMHGRATALDEENVTPRMCKADCRRRTCRAAADDRDLRPLRCHGRVPTPQRKGMYQRISIRLRSMPAAVRILFQSRRTKLRRTETGPS